MVTHEVELHLGAEGALYGNYVVVPPGDSIDEAKALLLEELKRTIDELAKNDRFWIIKDVNTYPGHPVPGIMPNSHTVGWKIAVPQLSGQKSEEESRW